MIDPLTDYVSCESFSSTHVIFFNTVGIGVESYLYLDVVKDPKWRTTMREEITALENNGTWTIETLLPWKKAIGCKWVYKIKYKSDGSNEWYKAHLVVHSDTQVEGLYYAQTFVPVKKLVSVRLFLVVAVIQGWKSH